MNDFDNIDDILDFAISEEEKAVDFYSELANKATTSDMKKIFVEFAKEEMGHKAKLMKIKSEKHYTLEAEKVADLKISDYIVNVTITPDMTYGDALVVAMKKEKSAFKLYMTLADKAPNAETKSIFMTLAQEESKHKLKFEIEYDEFVMREN